MTDRALDLLRPLVCLAVGVAMFALVAPHLELWNLLLSFAIGCVGTIALGFHRRAPIATTVIAIITAALTPFATPAMWTSIYLVALRQRRRVTIWILALGLASHAFLAVLFTIRWHPQDLGEVTLIAVLSALITVGVTVVGLLVHGNRDAAAARAGDLLVASGRVQNVGEDAHNRMIGAVHDDVGHRLALLSIYSHSLERFEDLSPSEREEVISHLRQQIDGAGSALTSAVSAASHRTEPTGEALDRMIAEVRAAGVPVGYQRDVELATLPPAIGELTIDFAREALTNAMRHGGHGSIRLDLHADVGRITCAVGSTLGRGSTAGAGTGLARLDRRAAVLGGSVEFVRTADEARTTLVLPVPPVTE